MATKSTQPHQAHRAFANRKRKPEIKKEAVLLTAAHLFLQEGYRRTSMEDIADRLEITKPALYHYFSSKEAILVGCYSSGIANILTRLDNVEEASGSGLERTREFLRVWIDVMTTLEFGQCVVTLDDNELTPAARREVRTLKRRMNRILREQIAYGVADGTIRACNVRLVAFAFGGAINSIGTWYNPKGGLNRAAFAEVYTDILTDGIRVLPKRTARAKKSAAAKSQAQPT